MAGNSSAMIVSLFAETALHPGTGQSTGIVDLPIQRERHTAFPIIPGSSLKGSFRECAERNWESETTKVDVLFGPTVKGGSEMHAGSVSFTDARLLAFPVRTLNHVFVWVTCPLVLGRVMRDFSLAQLTLRAESVPKVEGDRAVVPSGSQLDGTIVLEDMTFQTQKNDDWTNIAKSISELLPETPPYKTYRERMEHKLILIADEEFEYLVTHATQITARIALDDATKTTSNGGNLWYEETIPADTLFYFVAAFDRPHRNDPQIKGCEAVRSEFAALTQSRSGYIQVGGNETVGQGWCVVRAIEEAIK